MIPLLHDFSGEAVLIFGGGPVGARKARRFAREARVVVVSPAFTDAEFGDAERVRAAPSPDDVPEWFERIAPALAIAATDDEAVNDAVARVARERGTLHNRADRSGGAVERSHLDVTVPATVRDDPVLMAVATGGTSPALSRYLRERFEEEFAGVGAMATLTGELREQLREDTPAEQRRAAVRAVVRSDRVWKALGDGTHTAEQEAQSVISDVLSGMNER
ncbi:precorrin-2 dehydrogenase/sirohydrochlorin ferrochelatase family protein [Halococcus qingdaonensis]|uniref:precorrin-2 dehydrogenase/sirohydrochlorin ferrochelatase family protein n=1 Tax=Halococcus qingdaonensis TaxID=224402 RepID=UPI002115EA2B|nr:bifunctional precorrin-2 dehydrogenase/sirohydrochlorin ferrochelatase [Halococcus qingdaonensis]